MRDSPQSNLQGTLPLPLPGPMAAAAAQSPSIPLVLLLPVTMNSNQIARLASIVSILTCDMLLMVLKPTANLRQLYTADYHL